MAFRHQNVFRVDAGCAILAWLFMFAWIGSPAAFSQSTDTAEMEPGWAIAVIKLHYANAEEVAVVLEAVLPPTVRIVPYPPTNSLIISGDPALIGSLQSNDEAEVSEPPAEQDVEC